MSPTFKCPRALHIILSSLPPFKEITHMHALHKLCTSKRVALTIQKSHLGPTFQTGGVDPRMICSHT